MVPMRSEHEEGTGVTFASGRPRFVMRSPSAGRPSNNCKHCSRKSLTFNVFILQVYRKLYMSAKSRNAPIAMRPQHRNLQPVDFGRELGRGEWIRTTHLLVPNCKLFFCWRRELWAA